MTRPDRHVPPAPGTGAGRATATAGSGVRRGPAARPRPTPSRGGAIVLVLALALLLAAALPAPRAAAATYTVWSCHGPAGEPLPTAAWSPGGEGGTTADDCAGGGALRATLGATDVGGGTAAGHRFVPPPGATVAGWRLWMSAGVAPTTDGSTYAAGAATADALSFSGFQAGCLAAPGGCTWGDAADPFGAGNVVVGGASGVAPAVAVRCQTVAGCTPASPDAAHVALHRSAVDLVDDRAPLVGTLGGGLLGAGPVDGRRSVVVPVADAGGGVARTELLIDGVPVQAADTGGTCAVPYVVATPCAAQADRAFEVDTAALAPGEHTVAARVLDAAGNATDAPARSFVVGARTAPDAGPPPADTRRRVSLVLPARVGLPERRRTTGRAAWPDGSPAAGERLDVMTGGIGRPVSRMQRLGRVTVRADGTFLLPRTEDSRTLRVVPTDEALSGAAEVDLVAPLRASLRGPRGIVRNGRRMSLRGTVRGAGDAAPDLQVLVQSIVRGRWSTVDAVRPGPTGNVVWRYRFRSTVRPAAYRFRLVIPASRARPWRRTTSPRTIVRVRP